MKRNYRSKFGSPESEFYSSFLGLRPHKESLEKREDLEYSFLFYHLDLLLEDIVKTPEI
jgi:hypothetical protein